MWLLKLLAELNHRRWFSATDINTDQGGAGACQLAAHLRQGLAIRLWFGVRMATTSRRFGRKRPSASCVPHHKDHYDG